MDDKKLRVAASGGGTGGHIYPALAIIEGIRQRHKEVEMLYVGTKNGLEAKIVPQTEVSFEVISGAGFDRKNIIKNIKTIFASGKGVLEAMRILKRFKPHIVIGTGGYVCGPAMLAAKVLKIPTLIHEQNAFPGLTNRMLAKFMDCVCVTFEESVKYFGRSSNVEVTGLPIRSEILKVSRKEAADFFGLDPDARTILVVGGSRGAKSVNKAVLPVVRWAAGKKVQLIFVTGEKNYDYVIKELNAACIDLTKCENIKIIPYLYEMEFGLATADLVVSRAGASFLAEVSAVGIPGIFIPYPYASGDHQNHNALAFKKKGAADLIKDEELDEKILLAKIEALINNKEKLAVMAQKSREIGNPDALKKIIDKAFDII